MNQCNTLRCDGDQEACDFPSAKNDRWMNGNCTGVSSGPSQLYGCESPKGEKIDISGSTHRESRQEQQLEKGTSLALAIF